MASASTRSGRKPKIELPYTPRPQLIPYHERTQRWACLVLHRRFGKTTGTINDLQRGALTCPLDKPRFAYIAPLLKQAKDVAWDMLKSAAAPLVPYGAKFNEAELRVDYPNGGRVRLYGADNPDAMRGVYLDGVVMDEYAQHPPGMWTEVIRPALADRDGWGTFIGTPKGRDAFWKVYRNALANPEEWFSLLIRASESGVISDEELEAIRKEMDDPAAYLREMECSFDVPSEMQFIGADIIHDAVTREGVRPGSPVIMGVDIARAGADSNVILLRRGDHVDGDEIHRFKQADLMQTVGRISDALGKYAPDACFIDGGGVGGGVIDRLRQLGFRVTEVNFASKATDQDRFRNLRAEMQFKVRMWLKDRGKIPHDERLIDDLAAPNYKYDGANRLQIESKEEMRIRGVPSPDVGDALALTFAQAVGFMDINRIKGQLQYYEDSDPFDYVGGRA